MAEGSDEEAAEVCHRVVLRDPLREDAHRDLMAAWSRLGQRNRALRHFEELRTFLRTELAAEPETSTAALAEKLREGEGAAGRTGLPVRAGPPHRPSQ